LPLSPTFFESSLNILLICAVLSTAIPFKDFLKLFGKFEPLYKNYLILLKKSLLKYNVKIPNLVFHYNHLQNKYLSLDNILHTIRPILSSNNLAIVQALAGEYLVTALYHVSGQYIQSEMPFSPMSGNKGTNALQELGGGITYAKRYALSAMLGISVDIDDDAQSSGNIKKEQLEKPKPKKEVKTEEEMQKLLGWLSTNPDRLQDVEKHYLLTNEQKELLNLC
jgi:hypothetical protein